MSDVEGKNRDRVFSNKVVFRLADFIGVDDSERMVRIIESGELGPWSDLVDAYPGISLREVRGRRSSQTAGRPGS